MDIHVGRKLRQRRHETGITQERLAEESGVTFQQIQKYENAKNRISVSRLHDFAAIMDVPISWFFSGFNIPANTSLAEPGQEPFGGRPRDADPNTAETKELIKLYYSLSDPKLRKELVKFVKRMVETLGAKGR